VIRKCATLLVLPLVLFACAHGPARDVAAARQVIDEIRKEFESAETAGSTERMRVHITEDVVMMAPNMPAVSGADNAMAAMRGFFEAFGVRIKYNSEETVVAGDWAFDRGTYRQTLAPKRGGAAVNESGNYLWLYRREADGRWKQARVIWNSSDSPAGAPSN
jgi:ketosteroid isomerase-like protein